MGCIRSGGDNWKGLDNIRGEVEPFDLSMGRGILMHKRRDNVGA